MTDRELVEHFLAEVVAATKVAHLSPTLTPDEVRAAEIVAALLPVARASGRGLDWVGVNDRRVDVGVVAPGREWRVVCSIDELGVHSATTFEKPPPFAGVDGGRAVIVNGPSSAGKSTVMAAVVEAADSPWVMFDEIFFGTVKFGYLIWHDAAPTLHPGFMAGITALAAAGNQVITTGGPAAQFDVLRRQVPTLTVGLDCPLDVRVARQQGRPDRWGGLTEETESAHDGWTYDVRFDSSRLRADEIAQLILRELARNVT